MKEDNIHSGKLFMEFHSHIEKGLSDKQVKINMARYGENKLSPEIKKSFLMKLINGFRQPIYCRVFQLLNNMNDNIKVRVVRDNEIYNIFARDLVVGDLTLLKAGEKILADGVLVQSCDLEIDKSIFTEIIPCFERKDSFEIKEKGIATFDEDAKVYSGTSVVCGDGIMLVTSVGDKTEIAQRIYELNTSYKTIKPLEKKLKAINKSMLIVGSISGVIIPTINMARKSISEILFQESIFIDIVVALSLITA